MALARYPERTVLVEVGKVRQMSDLLGRHVVRLDNSPQRRKELLDRMATAGCAVNLQGADWMTIGDLSG